MVIRVTSMFKSTLKRLKPKRRPWTMGYCPEVVVMMVDLRAIQPQLDIRKPVAEELLVEPTSVLGMTQKANGSAAALTSSQAL